jgi:hypothetical protein
VSQHPVVDSRQRSGFLSWLHSEELLFTVNDLDDLPIIPRFYVLHDGTLSPHLMAYDFKPGQSGNPGRRPKNTVLSKTYRAALESPHPNDPQGRTYAMLIAERLVKQAVNSEKYSVSAAAELADHTEGKARQALDLAGKLETPASTTAVLLAKVFSPEVLANAIRQLAAQPCLNGGSGRNDADSIREPKLIISTQTPARIAESSIRNICSFFDWAKITVSGCRWQQTGPESQRLVAMKQPST